MLESEYQIKPEATKYILILLGILLAIFVFTSSLWIDLINAIIGLFVDFSLRKTFVITFLVVLLFTYISFRLLLKLLNKKVGWYKISIDPNTGILKFDYRSSLTEEYKTVDMNMRHTLVRPVESLLWVINNEYDELLSIIFSTPPQKDNSLYRELNRSLEINADTLKDQYKDLSLSDIQTEYVFTQGVIKAIPGEEFKKLFKVQDLVDIEEDEDITQDEFNEEEREIDVEDDYEPLTEEEQVKIFDEAEIVSELPFPHSNR